MHIDKLISRIKSVLNGDTGHFEIQTLAIEYADLVVHVRDRLEQCATLIRAGNDYAALQVAESTPHLLDTVARLAFAESREWIALCRERNIPWPPSLDQRNIDLVNGLYGRQISESHPLYRDYRQAIRERDELRALAILTSIIRINADDQNARSEFLRLGEKIRVTQLHRLEHFLDTNATDDALALADILETLRLPVLDDAPALQRARKLREARERETAMQDALEAIRKAGTLLDAGNWQAAIPLLGRCRALMRNHSLPFDNATRLILAAQEEHAGNCQSEHEVKLARMETIRLAVQALRTASAIPASVSATRTQLTEYAHALQFAIGAVEALDDGADGTAALAGYRALLEDARRLHRHLNKRIRHREISFVVAIAAALAMLVYAGFAVQQHLANSKELALALANIEQLQADKHLLEAERFLADHKRDWNSSSAFDAARTKLEDWAKDARATLTATLANADALSAVATTPATLQEAETSLASLRKTAETLPPDTHDIVNQRISAAADALRDVRTALAAAALPPFAGQLDTISQHLTSIRALNTTAGRLNAIEMLQHEVAQLDTDGAAIRTLLTPELAKRWRELTASIATMRDDERQTDATENALDAAQTLESYLDAIGSADDKKPAFARIQAAVGTLKNPAEKLLTPEALPLWQFAAATATAEGAVTASPFLPAQIQPGEAVDAARLTQNKIFEKLQRHTLRVFPPDAETPDTVVFSTGIVRSERFSLGDGYELRQSADILKADGTTERRTFRLMLLSPRRSTKGESLTDSISAPESAFLARFSRLYDPATARITEPLLGTLDRVRNATDIPPLLKACLQQEILKLIESRPIEWGIQFSPTARRDAVKLRELTQGKLALGDWLAPAQWNERLPDFKKIYTPPQPAYLDEALAWLRLFQRLTQPGFVFVGHVNAQKQLHLVDPASHLSGLLTGVATDGRLVLLTPADILAPVYTTTASGLRPLREDITLAPYTPLLMLAITPDDAAVLTRFPASANPPSDGWRQFIFLSDPASPAP